MIQNQPSLSATNSQWKKLLEEAKALQHQSQHQKAVEKFKAIPNWSATMEVLVALARCYQDMKNYDEAISTYKTVKKWKNKRLVLVGLFYIYREMQCYEEAIKMLNHIPKSQHETGTLLCLASCYEKLERYDDAASIYLNIFNLRKENRVLINLGRCYQEMGQYAKAIQTLQMVCSWNTDKRALLGLAFCYIHMQEFDLAIKMFQSVADWQNDKEVLLGLARCYVENRQYDQALESYKRVQNWDNDKEVLIGLIYLYLHLKDNEKMTYYINRGLKLFPTVTHFMVLQANYCTHDSAQSIALLLNAKKRYPNSASVWFNLMHQYVQNGDLTSARQLYLECQAQFNTYLQFLQDIEALINFAPFSKLVNVERFFKVRAIRTINFPARVQKAFSDLKGHNGQSSYLIGSTVLDLLSDMPTHQTPLDFITDSSVTQDDVTSRLANLLIAPAEQPIQASVIVCDDLRNDFTIRTLISNDKGEVFDPTGMGIKDLEQNILRTVGDATECLAENPLRVLTAAEYMVQGFKATVELKQALANWESPVDYEDKSNFIALTNDLLARHDAKVIFAQLAQYGLIKKLYHIDDKDPHYFKRIAFEINRFAMLPRSVHQVNLVQNPRYTPEYVAHKEQGSEAHRELNLECQPSFKPKSLSKRAQ